VVSTKYFRGKNTKLTQSMHILEEEGLHSKLIYELAFLIPKLEIKLWHKQNLSDISKAGLTFDIIYNIHGTIISIDTYKSLSTYST
jgi:hypothetical protein